MTGDDTVDILDLFAGFGWLFAARALRLREAGVDNMATVQATRDRLGAPVIFADAWDGLRHTKWVPEHRILVASPPCQPFSRLGKGHGRREIDGILELIRSQAWREDSDTLRDAATSAGLDERTSLVVLPLAYAFRHEPELIAWEQVPSVLPVWEAAAVELRSLGYDVWTGELSAEEYGTPQVRKRAILMASRIGPVAPPAPTHQSQTNREPSDLPRPITAAQALWPGLSREAVAAVAALTEHNQSNTKFDLGWPYDRPALTIAGRRRMTMPGANRNRFSPPHVTKSRNDGINITIEQMARLQGLPPELDEALVGKQVDREVMLGNVVPPPLGQAILQALLDISPTSVSQVRYNESMEPRTLTTSAETLPPLVNHSAAVEAALAHGERLAVPTLEIRVTSNRDGERHRLTLEEDGLVILDDETAEVDSIDSPRGALQARIEAWGLMEGFEPLHTPKASSEPVAAPRTLVEVGSDLDLTEHYSDGVIANAKRHVAKLEPIDGKPLSTMLAGRGGLYTQHVLPLDGGELPFVTCTCANGSALGGQPKCFHSCAALFRWYAMGKPSAADV